MESVDCVSGVSFGVEWDFDYRGIEVDTGSEAMHFEEFSHVNLF